VLSFPGTVRAAEQYVDWVRESNVAVRGNMLEKVGGCDGCDDAGAVSRQSIRSGDGYVEFRVGDPYTFWVAGLTQAPGNPRFNAIDFAFRFNGNGWADVVENGSYQPDSDTESGEGDVFRIAVVRGRVQYVKNGRLLHESRRAPRYPLVFTAALGTTRASVADARMETRYGAFTTTDRYGADSATFSSLDRNRDGVISRSEWSGSIRDFMALDANGDNRVSRNEMARGQVSSPWSAPVGTSGRQIIVDSRQAWTDTGVWVEAGDVISFDADGTIQMSDNGGDTASPAGSPRQALEAPMRSVPAGTLIGRIGNSAPIAIGSRRTVRAPVSGEVFLGVNDDHLPDNRGEYRVMLSVDPR
jgi:EF hand domain-containing protein